jgi:hypothetical protein
VFLLLAAKRDSQGFLAFVRSLVFVGHCLATKDPLKGVNDASRVQGNGDFVES